jgi:hypothetical protein
MQIVGGCSGRSGSGKGPIGKHSFLVGDASMRISQVISTPALTFVSEKARFQLGKARSDAGTPRDSILKARVGVLLRALSPIVESNLTEAPP